MINTILIAVAVIIVIFLVIVALQSAKFRVTRTIVINALPPAVFAQVNDFHNWALWSPWAKLDPAMKLIYDGPPSGTGATYAWTGNKEVGEGRMTIIESRPNDLVRIKLEFLRPFKATNTAEFLFKSEGDQTAVTWSMFGDKNFIFKAVHMFMNMDKLVGRDFEKGLAQMKSVTEAATK